MSVSQLCYETPAERLLLVILEEPARYDNGPYRHIRATVVRRAVSNVVATKDGQVSKFYDGTAVGYRRCTWNKSTNGAVFVESLQLRGQIDSNREGDQALNGGAPYGNKVTFNPYLVESDNAQAMCVFYAKWDKYLQKEYDAGRRSDSDRFTNMLTHLAKFLGITSFLFAKFPNCHNLEMAQNFEERVGMEACEHILQMLAPFATKVEA
jgi:hypothetical protein